MASNIKINRPPRLFLVHQQDEKPGINFAWPKFGVPYDREVSALYIDLQRMPSI